MLAPRQRPVTLERVADPLITVLPSMARGPKMPTLVKALCRTVLILLLACVSAQADEYRAFWVDAWGNGFLNQTQVEKLLGKVGDATNKGDIRNANCNAVFVQVRRRADVCYPSGVGEPYMSGLSPSTFNALQAMIDA